MKMINVLLDETYTTIILDSASYADIIEVVGYPIMNMLPGAVFAFAVLATLYFFFKRMRK